MITLLFVVLLLASIALGIIAHRIYNKGYDGAGFTLGVIAAVLGAVSAILGIYTCYLWYDVSTGEAIEQMIAMYQEQNEEIESSIETTVSAYMDFEERTYGELKDEDAINLVSLFPELKSDVLVQQQINVYIANNDQIKQLREEQINLSRERWLLYFGK